MQIWRRFVPMRASWRTFVHVWVNLRPLVQIIFKHRFAFFSLSKNYATKRCGREGKKLLIPRCGARAFIEIARAKPMFAGRLRAAGLIGAAANIRQRLDEKPFAGKRRHSLIMRNTAFG